MVDEADLSRLREDYYAALSTHEGGGPQRTLRRTLMVSPLPALASQPHASSSKSCRVASPMGSAKKLRVASAGDATR